ncbi:hypothetical protein EAS54_29585 [Bradyrhizobium guangzhouense]|nr:hypothetical protein EAS54_29585 [Bradyrhizobium guangzhouense]
MAERSSRFLRWGDALSPSWRAQRSNPESLRRDSLDCFAALAMTTLRWILRQEPSALAATSAAACRASGARGGRCACWRGT